EEPPVEEVVAAAPPTVSDDTEGDRIREALGSAGAFDAKDDDASVPLETLPVSISAPTRPALVDRLAAVKQKAQRSGLIGGHANAGIAPSFQPFSPPADTVAVRLEMLVQWIRVQFQSSHVCLADSRGESLTSAEAPAGLPVASTLLADALDRSQTEGGLVTNHAVHSALEDGQVLTVIAVPTTEGLFSIAVIRNAPLSHRDIHHCRDGFHSAIEARASAR
ncbi:MAG: hypothetical protein O3C21_19630, partial [Verrucomicrobia bacterium]|nr:hypothetical protein [Verrucomicrobiota bacterium]